MPASNGRSTQNMLMLQKFEELSDVTQGTCKTKPVEFELK